MNAPHQPASPCTGVCRIEQTSGLCTGCKRTLTEIADWPMLGNAEKRAMLRALEQRQ
jgi:predicted Fe-S protein YdhL (DUF1289 family)